jgi:hypothetical protein
MTVKAKDAAGNVSAASLPLIVTTAFPATYGITIQVGANGIVKENNVTLTNATVLTVNRSATKTFTFIPAIGYEVATLTYNSVNVKSQIINNQYTTSPVIATGTLSVTFQKTQYHLTLKSAENGTINLLCDYGATPAFDFTPSFGWKVNSVTYNSVDVTGSLVNGIYTTPAISANSELNVSFVSTVNNAPEYVNSNLKVYTTSSEIIVDGTSEGETIGLYTTNGKQIQTLKSQGERIIIPVQRDAVYLVKTTNKTFKVAL